MEKETLRFEGPWPGWRRLAPAAAGLAAGSVVVALLWQVPVLRQRLAHASAGLDLLLTGSCLAWAVVAAALAWHRRASAGGVEPSPRGGAAGMVPKAGLWAAVLVLISIPVVDSLVAVWPGNPPELDRMTLWPARSHVNGLLLPYSDALAYLEGAEEFAATGELDEWNGRRPINALLLYLRLAACRHDLRLALLVQAWMVGLALVLLLRAVGPDLGASSAALLLALVFGVCYRFLPSTMSEPLGLTVGALAAAILWSAARARSLRMALVGIFVATVAQNARIGAVFALPMLVVWIFLFLPFRRRWGRCLAAAAALLVIMAGLLFNGVLRGCYGGEFGLGHGNFALTLYGFSTGSPGYRQAYEDLPELRDGYTDVYSAAVENIKERPADLLRGVARAVPVSVRELATLYYERFKVFRFPALNLLLHALVGFGVLRLLWYTRRTPETALLLANAAGALMTAPIAIPDGNPRVFMATYPLLFIPVAAACLGLRPRSYLVRLWERSDTEAPAARGAALLAMLLVAVSLVGPGLVRSFSGPAPQALPADDHAAGETALVAIGPRTIRLCAGAPGQDGRPTFAPHVRHEDMAGYLLGGAAPQALADAAAPFLDGPFCIVLGREEGQRDSGLRWIVGPPQLVGDGQRLLRLVGARSEGSGMSLFVVSDFEEVHEAAGAPGESSG